MAKLSHELEMTLRRALRHANARQHKYAGTAHLLIALLENEGAEETFGADARELNPLYERLSDFLDRHLQHITVNDVVDAVPSDNFAKVIRSAAERSVSMITTKDVVDVLNISDVWQEKHQPASHVYFTGAEGN